MTIRRIRDHGYESADEHLVVLNKRNEMIMEISALRRYSATVARNDHQDPPFRRQEANGVCGQAEHHCIHVDL